MNFLLFAFCLVGWSQSFPQDFVPAEPAVPILESSFEQDDRLQYAFKYLTANGIAAVEQGSIKPNDDGTAGILVKKGSFAYVDGDNKRIKVEYIADENGFQPIISEV